ncbi:MAG: hypothetical protein J7L73_00705 [Anaerolineales bacterium]|nr:hypothetical protein [Anaerolineales bacterium]HEY61598.1 hypothetical protein [Anaerolineae bacterium]
MSNFLNKSTLDIRTGVTIAISIAILVAIITLLSGIRAIQKGRNLKFFRMRRDHMVRGWRYIFISLFLGALALGLKSYGEPVAYRYFPPSPTPTFSATPSMSPTISPTPSITLSPTITNTPSQTDTPTITPTPHIPLAIETYFEGTLTPPSKAAFSDLVFTSVGVDALYRPIEPSTVFTNPISSMYAVFSYDVMVNGVQWTALWYRNGELVHFETKPWDGGTGGLGFTDWTPEPEEWLPGDYSVQIFVGYDWVVAGNFTLSGEPAISTPTQTPTLTKTNTPTSTNTPTRYPTFTSTLKPTPYPTQTRTQTPIPVSQTPSMTPTPTITRWPTATRITPSPTITRWPTATKP